MRHTSLANAGPLRRASGSPIVMTVLLALLTAVGPISTDMYLPAFPMMRASLHAHAGQTQLTLAAWFFGLSIGQLVHGHLADQYGRRVPLLLGTLLYTVASIGCALASTMADLSWWRLWAAFGGAASLVIPRAIFADVATDGAQAARILSRMVMVMGVVPAIAPVLGGLIANYWSWRFIFWAAALYGGSCSTLVYLLLPDTLKQRRERLRPGLVAVRYLLVWRNQRFRAYALQGGFATFGLFAFLGGAPGVFQMHFGLSPEAFGIVFILNTIGYVLGTQTNARLLARFPSERVLTGGTIGLSIVSLAMVVLGATDIGGVLALSGAMLLFMGCLGLVLPGAALGSVLRHGSTAGIASAIYGTVVFFIGSVGTGLVGWCGEARPWVMTGVMLIGSLLAASCDRWRARLPTSLSH